jgi:hypothetical protein
MFTEPLERWEILGYPLLILAVSAFRSQPLHFYPAHLWQLEVLSFTVLGVWEIWRSQRKRPGLARAILIALSVSLTYTSFNSGDHRIMYAITLGLMLWLWFLTEGVPTALFTISTWLKRSKR